MRDVYTTLKQLPYFIDNEYLEKYSLLVERNTRTSVKPRITNKHHIIPKSWFKIQQLTINNDLTNLVNLVYRDHVLAHYYLCLCTEEELQFANELALFCLISRNKLNVVDKALLKSLPLYNNICESHKLKRESGYKLYRKEDVYNDNKSTC